MAHVSSRAAMVTGVAAPAATVKLGEQDAATLVRSLIRSLRAAESESRFYQGQYEQTLAGVGELQRENNALRERLGAVAIHAASANLPPQFGKVGFEKVGAVELAQGEAREGTPDKSAAD